MSRIVMFVLNDVTNDSRVRKEAGTLAALGHEVTILGLAHRGDPDPGREAGPGFEIIRVRNHRKRSVWRGRARPAAVPTASVRIPARGRVAHGGSPARSAIRSAPVPIDSPAAPAPRTPALDPGRAETLRAWWDRTTSQVDQFAQDSARVAARRDFGALAQIGEEAVAWVLRGARRRLFPSRTIARAWAPVYWAIDGQLGGGLEWLLGARHAWFGWAEAAITVAPRADVWHAHDLTALPAALRAQARHGGVVVYDSHEIFLESASHALRPRWARTLLASVEGRWARRCAAVVTVNQAVATELTARYRLPRVVVVDNCPPRWAPTGDKRDRLRDAIGIEPGTPIAIYHGGFSPHRGLEELAAALLEPGLERVHGIYLGYGALRSYVEDLTEDPRFGGRIHLIDAVPPEELLDWIATADVEVMAIQPSTLNHRLATGNKLFEALAVGLPIVASDLPGKREVILGYAAGPLGELCDPTDVQDVARAMRAILGKSASETAALRARCYAAAQERWNWEIESARLVALYADLDQRVPTNQRRPLASAAYRGPNR